MSMQFDLEMLESFQKELVQESSCMKEELDEFKENKSYDNVFSMERILDRIEYGIESAKNYLNDLADCCDDEM